MSRKMQAGADAAQGRAPAPKAALLPPEHLVERAAGEMRRGAPILVQSAQPGRSAVVAAAETLPEPVLAVLAAKLNAVPDLILTHARAATLKIRLYTPDVVAIAPNVPVHAADLRAIADPAMDLDYPMKGPFEAKREALSDAAAASVKLAKLAGLLPATVLFLIDDEMRDTLARENDLARVPADAINSYDDIAAETLTLIVRARVPLAGAEDTELAAFRPKNGGQEHYAIIIGAKDAPALATPGPVLTRLHSECFTGDLLGSLKCDCGDQLRGAISAIAEAGGGVLLYLAQEGRGIGLMNKLRAYRLQDEGFDTMEANTRLGFAEDERAYDIAARMLKLLGYSSVKLMTNNPDKMSALEKAGIHVAARVPHSFPDNEHNRDYLRVKAEKGGHLL